MQNEGPERYAFTPPADSRPQIEFKKVRRSPDPATAPRRTRKVPRRRIALTAAGLVLVLLAAVGWVGFQGYRAKYHLQTAAGLFLQLQGQITRGDTAAAKGTLAALQQETRAAHDETGGIGWTAATHVPGLGDDLAAVRTVSAVLDDLAANGLPALLDVASGLSAEQLSPRGGRVDLGSLNDAAPRIAAGLAVIRRADATVAGIDRTGLVGQLATAVGELRTGLGRAERLVATADRAAALLPPMLGTDGPRNYLVLFQNNAEVRATGGMPGAYLVLHADGGAVTVTDQGTAAGDLGVFDNPVPGMSQDLVDLYTTRPAVFPADVNMTPDFPTAASLARSMYAKRRGIQVDGVLATDPIALAYLLRVTGAVKVPGGETLTHTNAVRVLLSEAYAKYPDPARQDAYFASAARAIFDALIRGQGDPKRMLLELGRAAGERRLLVWSAHPEEQAALAGTVLQGRLPAAEAADQPTVGVFLNDGSGAKLDYYLAQQAELTPGGCQEDGSRQLRLHLVLSSGAPAAGLPAYVTGLGLGGRYTARTNVLVFGPLGGGVVQVDSGGGPIEFGAGIERGRSVGVFTVDLPPGASRTYDVVLQTAPLADAAMEVRPRLWTTPTVRPWKSLVQPGSGCAED